MAALVAGVQYGLSSQSHFYENKSLIFVKLTDSAQRAIEDFLKNRVSFFFQLYNLKIFFFVLKFFFNLFYNYPTLEKYQLIHLFI